MSKKFLVSVCIGAGVFAGCGGNASFFNPAFTNALSGEYFPTTPGPGAAFVLVRGVNETQETVEFVITVERQELLRDDDGNFQIDDQGRYITRPIMETVRLTTFPLGRASDLGVLFPCRESPITRVGLGENLLPTDAAVFVGGQGVDGAPGFGVPPGNVNPLVEPENFACGDTVIFRALTSIGVAGGVKLESFLSRYDLQHSEFRGPDTFVNYEEFLETQVRENEP